MRNCWLIGLSLLFTAQAVAADDLPLPRVPAGFEVDIVAAPPLVERPVMANFDDRGRLFVVDSAGVNLRFDDLVKDPPHRLVVLEDTDHDGRFDSRKVFADKLVMPQGVVVHRGAAYVASPPSVWKLEDTDGDGVADKRTEIVTSFGSNGNAADIHGPFLGPDGWLYLCDGRHGHKVTREDGTVSQGLAGGIFRFRTDGTGFERVCGGGFDNPVEVDFTPEGELLGTVNLLHGNPRMDCLMHWVEGGVYPRHDQEQCLAEFKRTGDLLPHVGNLGHVAVSGLTVYRSPQFGREYDQNVFMAIFNTHKVLRSVVERSGATFRSREEDFLVSDHVDFHPTDVLTAPDGSLLVINTGGWFRLGCPTSQTAKPGVLGAIYRIRKSGEQPQPDPEGRKIPWDELNTLAVIDLLNDVRPAIRDRAIEHLVALGDPIVPDLQKNLIQRPNAPLRPELVRRNLVWTLTRINTPASRAVVRAALQDPSESIRQTAVYSLGMTGDVAAIPQLLPLVVTAAPQVRREAATTLGRLCAAPRAAVSPTVPPADVIPAETRAAVVRSLFDSIRHGVVDRFLEHALIFALIRIDQRADTLPFLSDPQPQVRRAALIALDQMDRGELTRDLVTPLLDTDDPALRQTALAVIGRRPGWAGELVTLLKTWLQEQQPTEEQLGQLRGVLLAQSADAGIQQLIGDTLGNRQTTPAVRLLLWEVIYRAGLDPLPQPWVKQISAALQHGSLAERHQVLAILQTRALPAFDAELAALSANEQQPDDLRIAALAAIAGRLPMLSDAALALLQRGLAPESPPLLKLAAARALGDAPLDAPQLRQVTLLFDRAGPLAIPLLLRAFARSADEQTGLALVAALNESPSAENLSADELGGILRKYPAPVQQAAASLLKRLGGETLEQQQARLQELLRLTDGRGDPSRGKAIYYGKKALCSGCHAVAGDGGRVGPDLTKIAAIRQPLDLLEAIAFPSASFARDFRPYTIVTTSGKLYTGVISRQTADAVYVRNAELSEFRIARSAIDEMAESNTSIMPKGIDTQLTPEELADLLAYLQTLK